MTTLNRHSTITESAEFLDKKVPDWFERIDLDALRMSSQIDCILGQLFSRYMSGIESLGLTLYTCPDVFANDTDKWKKIVTDRLKAKHDKLKPMQYEYSTVITFQQVYGSCNITVPGYKQLGFRPPLDGETYYGKNGVTKASHNFHEQCPFLILEKITREVVTFTEVSDSPRSAKNGEWFKNSDGECVQWNSSSCHGSESMSIFKIYDRVVTNV